MRYFIALVSVLSLSACMEDFYVLEEACDDSVPGDKNVSNDAAVATFLRTNCYRRLVKLGPARINTQIQEAAENHILYLVSNEFDLDFANGVGAEEPGQLNFTGADVYDRLEHTGYPGVDRNSMGVWEWRFIDPEEAAARVDFWFPDPFARQAFLQPSWVGGGYDEGSSDPSISNTAYMTIFYANPVTEASGQPVIYPKDGQTGVPTRFVPVDPSRVIYEYGETGYPISVTVGSTVNSSGSNPHGIELHNVRLTGPNGELELHTETPADGQLLFTMGFYPVLPLEPGVEYDFYVKMSWDNNEDREFTTTFRTGADGDGLPARIAPPRHMPQLTHRYIPLP